MAETCKVGIDVGGTFTDLFLWSSDGRVESCKVLSTPADPSVGVLEGLQALAATRDLALEEFAARIGTIVHGTTVTTNAVLTRGGARTGLLTTEGVRDALEMRRGIREERYDNRFTNVPPLVPRRRRLPVAGRLDYAGEEIAPLDLDEVRTQARALRAAGTSAVAICFMNAFANPGHERAAVEVVKSELPDAYVCASTDVLPVVRFYNRVSTTVLNAYVGPVLGEYLQSLTRELERIGFPGVLLIMQSNGGVALPEVTTRKPATTLLSGPAAGPTAALAYTEAHGRRDCLVVDMGGTSFDASLVRDGAAAMVHEGEIDRLRIALPMLGIITIGAGGGSIGWIDEGGLLRMGPRSAGAFPGPACYARGGEEPACTDADLVLGYLDPDFFAGGKLRLDAQRARDAIATRVAQPLQLDLEEAAAGMYRVINTNMAHGVREITIKRGLDPREFPMVVAGGAGALHACMIATELEIPSLLVPATASVLCAAGMLLSDLKHDYVRTYIRPFGAIDLARLRGLVDEMRREGTAELQREGVAPDAIRHEVALDLRYLKQYHEVTLPVPSAAIEAGDLDAIATAFHAEHDRLYGYNLAGEGTDLELINVRVRPVGRTDKPRLPELPAGGADPGAARKGKRRAYLPERMTFAEVDVFDGHALQAGNVVEGPALIERIDTTIFVTSGFVATIDAHGSCRLARREGQA
jgi:N-methylhydantoinase A